MTTLTAAVTPVLSFSIKPLRCGSAPAPPRKTRTILPPDQQTGFVDQFHASWPALPGGRKAGKEVNFPRLSLSVQHHGSKGQTPSPLAMLAFQRAFQKMKQQSPKNSATNLQKTAAKAKAAAKETTAPKEVQQTPTTTATLPLRQQQQQETATNKKPSINANTAAALERLNALAPSSPNSRKAARRRNKHWSPSNKQNAIFCKTASSGKLDAAILMGHSVPRVPSAGRLINNQMRRVRSSGSRGNLTNMLF